MPSAININVPVAGNPTTLSVRQNFATAAGEITALQTAVASPAIPDAGTLTIGTGNDIVVTADGTNAVVTSVAPGHDLVIADDVVVAFGGGKDVTATYISAGNEYQIGGSAVVAGGAEAGTASVVLKSRNRTVNDGAAGSPASGSLSVVTGNTDSTNAGGTGGDSGALTLATGNAASTAGTSGNSGDASLLTGISADADSGMITVASGDGDNSGDINITTGNGVTDSGSVSITTGAAGGVRGDLIISAANVSLDGTGALVLPGGSITATSVSATFSGPLTGNVTGQADTADGIVQGTPVNAKAASFTTALGDPNANLRFDAVTLGNIGNTYSVEYVNLGAGTPLAVRVDNLTEIVVELGIGGMGAPESTAAQIRDAIVAHPEASLLVIPSASGGDGSGVPISMMQTFLTGGVNGTPGSAGQFRWASGFLHLCFFTDLTTENNNWQRVSIATY